MTCNQCAEGAEGSTGMNPPQLREHLREVHSIDVSPGQARRDYTVEVAGRPS